MESYRPTIGIEVHAELKTKTKMFCSSKNDPHHAQPNQHICPVCMGHPGTLPVINKEAVKQVLLVGIALESELAAYTEFDRKNYFYPDIPKGYQISQYAYPLVKGGELCGVAVTRVHLEEDTARSQHDQGDESIIDYNRAGVPLMELVTEPVIHNAETAGDFARELQLLLRTLEVSDANMEKGEMRVEANISVSKTKTLGTKVEVKNLNSFKSVEGAIEYEIKRQIGLLEKGERIIQETRGWDENKSRTFSQRIKESSDDYRYFPDPDLPKLDISEIEEFSLSCLTENMPELPSNKRIRYKNLGLTREQSNMIASDPLLASFFDRSLDSLDVSKEEKLIKNIANYLTTDVQSILTTGQSISNANPGNFRTLMAMVTQGSITSRVAKDLLPGVLFEGVNPEQTAKKGGLLQMGSEEELMPLIRSIMLEHRNVVEEYRKGKETALQYLIGQGMKMTKGAANPAILAKLFKKEID